MQNLENVQLPPLDEIVTNLNYLIASKNIKTLLVFSENKGEGKSHFIYSVSPVFDSIYNKRVLILDFSESGTDSLNEILETNQSQSDLVFNTKFKGVDYISDVDPINLNIIESEVISFYDLVLINSTNYRNEQNLAIPDFNIDGAIIIRTDKTLNSKFGKVTNSILDKNIPIVGIVYNGAIK